MAESSSLHGWLADWEGRTPDAPFIIEAETGRELSYAEAARAVAELRLALGTRPARVVMSLPNGRENALVWLAALTGGHELVPLDSEAPPAERARLARRFPPDIVVVADAAEAADFATPDAPAPRALTRADCARAADAGADAGAEVGIVPRGDVPLRDGGVILMTSGSTGEPKGVRLGAAHIASAARAIAEAHGLVASDRGITTLPFSHVNAPVVSLVASLAVGASVIIAERFSRTRFWGWVERRDVTWISTVPAIVAMLLQTERPAFLPGRVRFVRTASAPLPVVHKAAFERRFGLPIVETYGLSEAASQVTANPVPPGVRKAGSVGVPRGVALRVCLPRRQDEPPAALEDVPPGEVGEVCVRGASVVAGYVGDAGRDSFAEGWFRTGDLGYRDADGYLFLTGRLRDVINRGGENIAPREIEEVLLAHPAVDEVAVVGESDPVLGQRVAAYVVAHEGRGLGRRSARTERDDALAEELTAFCRHSLARHKVPDVFMRVAALPRTRSGKIQRHLLVRQPQDGRVQATALAERAG